jgi:adenosine deaminase
MMSGAKLFFSPRRSAIFLFSILLVSVVSAQTTAPKSAQGSPELRTSRRFESLRKSPPQLLAFLRRMPKGGDLHNHLSGSIYAENYIQWAVDNNLCIDTGTLAVTAPPCDASKSSAPVSAALWDPVLYRRLIDAWSMRSGAAPGKSGHDHFFDAFGKFNRAAADRRGAMLAEVSVRAAQGQLSYLELMLGLDGGEAGRLGLQVGLDGDFRGTHDRLKANGLDKIVSRSIESIKAGEAERRRLLKCDTPEASPGCHVTIRYIAQVLRAGEPASVFAQMAVGLALASDPESLTVAINLVQPEDEYMPMHYFRLHMEMLAFLRSPGLYKDAHLSLHAGELAMGQVPPEGLGFHIRESVLKAGAERIGHGVSIMHEDDPYELLKELARRRVMIEICLSSNDLILGVRKEHHPLLTYLQYGVPVALATDDEGVSRSDMTREYLKAALDHGLTYGQLKTMARTSLEHCFLPGKSLWADAKSFRLIADCDRAAASPSCRQFLADSKKAQLQWNLEEAFQKFERQY